LVSPSDPSFGVPPSEPNSDPIVIHVGDDAGRGNSWEPPSQGGTPINRRVRSDSNSSIDSDAEERRKAGRAAQLMAAEKKNIAAQKAAQVRAAEEKRIAEQKAFKEGGHHGQRWKEYADYWRKFEGE